MESVFVYTHTFDQRRLLENVAQTPWIFTQVTTTEYKTDDRGPSIQRFGPGNVYVEWHAY